MVDLFDTAVSPSDPLVRWPSLLRHVLAWCPPEPNKMEFADPADNGLYLKLLRAIIKAFAHESKQTREDLGAMINSSANQRKLFTIKFRLRRPEDGSLGIIRNSAWPAKRQQFSVPRVSKELGWHLKLISIEKVVPINGIFVVWTI